MCAKGVSSERFRGKGGVLQSVGWLVCGKLALEFRKIYEFAEKQIALLEQNGDFFLEEARLLVDESQRPGKPKTSTDLFGVDGTFKKLDID